MRMVCENAELAAADLKTVAIGAVQRGAAPSLLEARDFRQCVADAGCKQDARGSFFVAVFGADNERVTIALRPDDLPCRIVTVG